MSVDVEANKDTITFTSEMNGNEVSNIEEKPEESTLITGKAEEADDSVIPDVPKDAVVDWPAPKQIHAFFFAKVRSYDDPQIRAKIEQADKDLQRKNHTRIQILDSVKAKRAERSNLKSKLQPFIAEKRKYNEAMNEKIKEMEPLREDLNKLRNANIAARERGAGLCTSEEELNNLIRSLHYQIQHESNTLNEEKKLLKEIKLLEATRSKVIANAALRGEIEGSKDQKSAIQDRVKLLGGNMDEVRKEREAVRDNIKQIDDELKVVEKDLSSLEVELEAAIERRDKAYETLSSLRKAQNETNACFYQNRSLLNNANELAAKKDISGLEALSNNEIENFFSKWNNSKVFRDDYERRVLNSLNYRQLSRDGRMRNPDEKPIITETSQTPITKVDISSNKVSPKQSVMESVKLPVSQDVVLDDTSKTKEVKKPTKEVVKENVRSIEAEEIGKSLDAPKTEVIDPERLKEMRREEEIAKNKLALERKKKNAEKAAAKAVAKAQKEAEKKQKMYRAGRLSMTASERKRRVERSSQAGTSRSDEGSHNEAEEEAEEELGVGVEDEDILDDVEETDEEGSDDDVVSEEDSEEEAHVDGGPQSNEVIKDYDTHIASQIWKDEERQALTCINHSHKVIGLEIPENATIFKELIEASGLMTLVNTCYRCVNKNLISAFIERWYPETNTFHMPFGEITITLDDVASLLHIPVEGRPIESRAYDMDSAINFVRKMLGISKEEARMEMNDRVGFKLSLSMLAQRFQDVNDEWNRRDIRRAARAYLLYLLGSTLFADKSKSHVHISLLYPLRSLEEINLYSWGSAALAFLYRQLGLASRISVKQIGGYLCLLETWIFEHFPCFQPSTRLYYENLPRAARWDPSSDCHTSIIDLRIFMDNMQLQQVIFDPYIFAREYHPFHQLAWYSGCLLFQNIVEPYHPNRVLRQFGRVQNIPPPPIPPVSTTARRGTTSTTYTRVRYQFLESIWEQWQNHVIAVNQRSIPLSQSFLSYTDDYMEWYRRISVLRVQNPENLPENVVQGAPFYQPSYDQLYMTLSDVHRMLDDLYIEAHPDAIESARVASGRFIH